MQNIPVIDLKAFREDGPAAFDSAAIDKAALVEAGTIQNNSISTLAGLPFLGREGDNIPKKGEKVRRTFMKLLDISRELVWFVKYVSQNPTFKVLAVEKAKLDRHRAQQRALLGVAADEDAQRRVEEARVLVHEQVEYHRHHLRVR